MLREFFQPVCCFAYRDLTFQNGGTFVVSMLADNSAGSWLYPLVRHKRAETVRHWFGN